MQPHPAFPKVKPVDSWATSWENVMGIVAGPGSTPDPVSSHENIRGGAFAPAQPLSPEGTTDLFRPFRALYFSVRTPAHALVVGAALAAATSEKSAILFRNPSPPLCLPLRPSSVLRVKPSPSFM